MGSMTYFSSLIIETGAETGIERYDQGEFDTEFCQLDCLMRKGEG